MGKIDIATAPEVSGSRYPAPYDEPCAGRHARRLGDAAGLTQFGVNLLTLVPGVWSSQRHWHSHEDEFAYVLSGEVVLVMDEGEEIMRAGDCVGWKAGVRNGHMLQNRSTSDAVILIVGSRSDEDWGEYSDIDMKFHPGRYSGGGGYTRKDGTPIT
ncbi:MAG: cupin domain-containing protein [Hyphomonadaceae bacterium]|nr:cupin domain-containing protein [Hyphomonadaceae bacterium]